jgi:hypothetical protein
MLNILSIVMINVLIINFSKVIGRSAKQVIESLGGYGEDALYAKWDDHDKAYEDIDPAMEPIILNDPFREARWRMDDIKTGGAHLLPSRQDQQLAVLKGKEMAQGKVLAEKIIQILSKRWLSFWKGTRRTLYQKIRAVSRERKWEKR